MYVVWFQFLHSQRVFWLLWIQSCRSQRVFSTLIQTQNQKSCTCNFGLGSKSKCWNGIDHSMWVFHANFKTWISLTLLRETRQGDYGTVFWSDWHYFEKRASPMEPVEHFVVFSEHWLWLLEKLVTQVSVRSFWTFRLRRVRGAVRACADDSTSVDSARRTLCFRRLLVLVTSRTMRLVWLARVWWQSYGEL